MMLGSVAGGGGLGWGWGMDWPDHFLEQYTLCFVHCFSVGGGKGSADPCASVFIVRRE